MTSEIRTNSLTSRAGLSTVTLTDSGPMFSGITTFVDNSGFNLGTGSSIFTPASNTLTFGTNSNERLRIDSSGRVLIGTVKSTNNQTHYDDLTINNSDQSGAQGSTGIDLIASNDAYGGIIFSDEDAYEQGFIKYYHNSNADIMRFGTNSNERWEISKDGYWIPLTDSFYDIGTNSARVRNGYFDTLYGDGSNLTGITGTTINGNTDHYVVTATGIANTLQGESSLTYDGNQLNVIQTTSSSDSKVVIANSNTPGSGDLRLEFQYGTGTTEGTNRYRFGYVSGYRAGGSNDGGLKFGTKPSNAAAPTERLRIDPQGRLLVGGTFERGQDDADNLTIDGSGEGTGRTGITIRSASNTFGSIFFSDATSGAAEYDGVVAYDHSSSTMRFSTNSIQRVFINSSHSSSTNAIMGVGTIPQTSQYSGYDIIQFGETGSLFSNNTSGDGNITTIANNLYLDATASSWKYLKTDEASRYQQDTGCHRFYSIASGSAGANCSPKQLAAFENNATNLASLAYGNRPQYKGQLVLFGQSYELENGGLEFHSSGGGGGGYGARITCYSDGALRVLNRSNSSAWTKTFRMLPTGSFEYGDAPASNLWTATDANGAHYRRSEGSHQFANKSSNGYSVLYCNKNTGSGQNDTRYIAFYWNGSQIGYIYYNSGVINYYTGSDHRLKENITDVADGISIVKQLKPKNFNFINDENKTTHTGFLAHEVQEVLPSLVNGVKDEVVKQESVDAGTQPEDSKAGDPIYQGLDYGKFTPILTKALQELITKVETLEQENIALRARVTNLEGN